MQDETVLARSENPFMLGCLLDRKSIPKQTFEEQDDSPTKKTSERTKADVVSAGPWMLCENGWSLGGRFSWLAHGCCARTDGPWVDVIMVGPGMLCESGVWVDNVLVGPRMLCENGWSLGGRYHVWPKLRRVRVIVRLQETFVL